MNMALMVVNQQRLSRSEAYYRAFEHLLRGDYSNTMEHLHWSAFDRRFEKKLIAMGEDLLVSKSDAKLLLAIADALHNAWNEESKLLGHLFMAEAYLQLGKTKHGHFVLGACYENYQKITDPSFREINQRIKDRWEQICPDGNVRMDEEVRKAVMTFD